MNMDPMVPKNQKKFFPFRITKVHSNISATSRYFKVMVYKLEISVALGADFARFELAFPRPDLSL